MLINTVIFLSEKNTQQDNMEFDKSDIEKVEETPKPQTVKDVVTSLRKAYAMEKLKDKATTFFSQALIEKCLNLSKRTCVVKMNNRGGYIVYETGEDIFMGPNTGLHLIADTISLEHLDLFWNTFYEFIEIAKGVGLEVSVSEKFTHNNNYLISFSCFYTEKM